MFIWLYRHCPLGRAADRIAQRAADLRERRHSSPGRALNSWKWLAGVVGRGERGACI